MSTLRVAVAHFLVWRFCKGITWMKSFLFLNLLLPFCGELNSFFFYFYALPQSICQAAQEYVCCLVILTICTSIKGVFPPLKWSVVLSPPQKIQISHCEHQQFCFFNQILHPLSSCSSPKSLCIKARHPSSQHIPSASRSHATYFKCA